MNSSQAEPFLGTYMLRRGNSKLIVSMPHIGTVLPEWLIPRITENAQKVPDTDWYLELLYDFLEEMDVTVISANYSRYVIDLNRCPNDLSIYQGVNVTGLLPMETFTGELIYNNESSLTQLETATRLDEFWYPYHHALQDEITRITSLHGDVVLWDAHSIRSTLPWLFDGQLPDLNIGTVDGNSCSPELTEKLVEIIKNTSDFSWVVNGRFKGGFITRHYGDAENVHSVQLEIAMRTYCDESGTIPEYDTKKANALKSVLKAMIESILG